jgi:MarR family transcriptional regulator, transcriptional regulator for hemolysin
MLTIAAMDVPLGKSLANTFKALREYMDARMAEHGGSMATWLVLHHAFEAPDLSQSHLAARLDIEAPTLVRHLDRLEADGLLERRRDARDRRVLRVRLTPAGQEAETRLRSIAAAVNAELRELLGADHDVFEQQLERIREHALSCLAERNQRVATS